MRSSRALGLLLVGTLAATLAGCGGSGGGAPVLAPHTHTGIPAGDGIRTSYVGYTLADLKVPARAGVPGRLSFHIETYQHKPLTRYVTDLTKDMHVYVVSTDFSVYRHVHPVLGADGTWRGNLTVPVDGTYRIVTEFTAYKPGGGDQMVLGALRTIGEPRTAVPLPPASTSATANGLTVTVTKAPTVGYEHQMELGLSKDGKAAALGTYLGVFAHLSAFDVRTGAIVHMHPLGPPVEKDGKSLLDFHTGFEEPGTYRMFVQARVSGIVWTVPITVEVTGQPSPEL